MVRGILISVLLLGMVLTVTAQQKANYELAEKFRNLSFGHLSKFSLDMYPRYINNSDRFWFDFTTEEGKSFYYVDPVKGVKRLLFENEDVARQASEITRVAYHARELEISGLKFSPDGKTITFRLDTLHCEYHLETKKLKRIARPEQADGERYSWMVIAPDSSCILYAKEHNLYMKGIPEKGKDTTETQLTVDGELYFSYAKDGSQTGDGEQESKVRWFKNSKKAYIVRYDSRRVEELFLVDVLSKSRPVLKRYKYDMAGAKEISQPELVIVDVEKRQVVKVKADKWQDQEIQVVYAAEKGDRIYFERYKRTMDQVELCVADTETGEVKVLIHEEDRPFVDYQMKNITFLHDGDDILYRSERTGWGHYYHYDGNGVLKNVITAGDWVAGTIISVDTLRREVYFYGYGREKGVDPYYSLIYRAHIDKGNVKLLGGENARHRAFFSPTHRYFVDIYATVSDEPEILLRDRKGKVMMELAKPDLRRLYEMGWRAPERFTVKAADGMTDLYGIMWKPADFNPDKKYPIISSVYPGPFFEYVNTTFSLDDGYNTELAQLGFIVVAMGHRGGSPLRGKFYHRYGYGNLRDYPLADDKYAIEQLADRYSFIDASRVGIYGHSGGGFMSVAAICTYPDFYTAAVSSAGNHDNRIYNSGWVETHHGVKETRRGMEPEKKQKRKSGGWERLRPAHEMIDVQMMREKEFEYTVSVPINQALAENLKGHLLLVTGDMDDNVHPAHTLRIADALIKARKNFDMYVLPGCNHGFGNAGRFFEYQLWHHFAKYLLGDDSAGYQTDLDYFMKR